MESLEGLCFTHLCSYLFFNELLVLRLVSTSVRRQLEGKELALNVRQTRALIFPSHWGDPLPGERSIFFLSSAPTKRARRLSWSGKCDTEVPFASPDSLRESRLSVSDNSETLLPASGSQAPLTIRRGHRTLTEEESNHGKEWKSSIFFRRFLSLPSTCEGLRELCLCWQDDDQPRRLSSALRELLKVCAPYLESLICSGSCLAVWRYSFPLVVDFPALQRLLIISSFRDSELNVRHYREQLTWHVLGRCQFPACLEFRWMDFFTENFFETFSDQVGDDGEQAELQEEDEAEEQGFRWHEIILQQVNHLTALLSSMKCLRDFTFTADSRYSIVQILLYLASRQEDHSVSTLEIIPAYPNIQTLERDWPLPPIPDAHVSGEEASVTLSSVTTLKLVLRNCNLDDFIGTEISLVLQKLCPYATICVSGSISTSLETAGETFRLISPQGLHTEPAPCPVPLDDFGSGVVGKHASDIHARASSDLAVGVEYDGSEDLSGRDGSADGHIVGESTASSAAPTNRRQITISSVWRNQRFCAAPLEIIFSIPVRRSGFFRCPTASVKLVRMTGVGSGDESAWLGIYQTLKELLHLKSIVLPSIRLDTVTACARPVADKIQELISCFPQIILSIEGCGTDPERFIHEVQDTSSSVSCSSPDFFRPSPAASSALPHSSSSTPSFFTTLRPPPRTNTEVVGLQISLLNGTLSSDVSFLLAILNRHPDVLFLRFVDTWSAAAFEKPLPCAESRIFNGIELNVLLRHNKSQIKVFEYVCVGPICWQREAGLYACNPVMPKVVGKEFLLHKKVAFLAAGGACRSDGSNAVQQVFSSLYVRGSYT